MRIEGVLFISYESYLLVVSRAVVIRTCTYM